MRGQVGRMLCTVGRGTLWRDPRCRGYVAEKAGEEVCAEGLYMRTKGEGTVKSNAEELGDGVECKGGTSQSSWD